MYESIVTILASAGVSSVLTGLILWLTKSWITERLKNAIKHEYDQKLETHKAELKALHDIALEQMKSDLRLNAFQQETRFADLHARRAETIAETYGWLRNLHTLTRRYIGEFGFEGQPSLADRRKDVGKALENFEEFYLPREIFLPAATANRINDFRNKHFKVIYKFKTGVEQGRDERTGKDSWDDSVDMMDNDVTPIFEELKNEFRQLLGDTPETVN
ncbi:MAG TPA: hypothetical protein DIT97_05180 [Gimesia maris]|uniref:Uncharacterized protein n=1 Tax=Gimesia maris TaxID=122 RepID=A0A3D3R4F8_9PLAN|nr:hypothetical protein [Gimesia maris]|tara:strand:+ start:21829 stop:22482 length:654 start_codon:yes stop_codon:yes gene_type:complete